MKATRPRTVGRAFILRKYTHQTNGGKHHASVGGLPGELQTVHYHRIRRIKNRLRNRVLHDSTDRLPLRLIPVPDRGSGQNYQCAFNGNGELMCGYG